MGMIPETDKDHSDYIDMLVDACRKPVKTTDSNGREVLELQLDTKKLNYKTQLVNYPGFGRFVFQKESMENLALDVFNYMSDERAGVIAKQILRKILCYDYSIDAKSSETLRDKTNSQSALTHILTRNKAERAITLKEEAGRSFMEALKGKEKKQATED